MPTPPTPTIPLQRTVKTRVEVLRRGEWIDVSRFLARAEINHGDHTGLGVNPTGVDEVVRTATIILKSSGSMRRYWPSTLSRLSTDLLGESGDRVAWSNDDASAILEWLFGPAAGWTRENLAPRDRFSPVNLVKVGNDFVYDPLLWSGKEIRVWGRTLSGLTPQESQTITGDGATSEYDLPHVLIEPETVRVVTDGSTPIEWEIDGWTGHLWLSRPLATGEKLTIDYATYSRDDGWKCDFHGIIGGDINANGTSVTLTVVDLSKRLQLAYILDPVETPYSGPMEDVMQAVIDDHPSTVGITLYFPSGTAGNPRPSNESPEWFVDEYAPAEMSVFDALGRLAARRGWFVGYRWHEPTGQMQLQLMAPPRWKDESTADMRLSWMTDFYAHDLADSDSQIINYVEIVWRDENGDEHTTPRQNADSIAKYGLRAGRIREDDTSEIRDDASAGRLGDAVIADMSEMRGSSALDMPIIPGMDVFTGFALDDPRVSSSEDFLGAENVLQLYDFEGGRFRSQVSGPNRVVGGLIRWIGMIARPGAKEPIPPEAIGGAGPRLPAPVSVLVSPIDEGLSVYVPAPPVHIARWGTTEIHVSTEPDFEPDESTLAAASQSTRFTVSPLAAVPHYVRARYIDIDGRPGAWSDEVAETPNEPYEPDLTSPDPPTLGVLDPQALDLGNGRYDVSVTVPFTVDERTVRVIFERRERVSTNPDVWSDWYEVGQATTSPWIDRGGLKAPGTYQYRARAESEVGVLSDPSDTEEVTIPTPTIVPPDVTGLEADFTGPDCVVRWNPVSGATGYKVEVRDTNGTRREVAVTDNDYTYTFADNKSDGQDAVPSPSLVIRVWAINAFDNQSLNYAEETATNAKPAEPTIEVSSSLSQLRWRVTSAVPDDLRSVTVQVGTYTEPTTATTGIIDWVEAGVEDGALESVTIVLTDVFGQSSDPATKSAEARYLTEVDMAGELFALVPSADPQPDDGDLESLWDMDVETGVMWEANSEPITITFRYPVEQGCDMARLYIDAGDGNTVEGYVQMRRSDNGNWIDVAGSDEEPIEFTHGWNVIRFTQNRLYFGKEYRIVFTDTSDSEPDGEDAGSLVLTELKFWRVTLADEILAQKMRLTGDMAIESQDGYAIVGPLESGGFGFSARNAAGDRSELTDGRLAFYRASQSGPLYYLRHVEYGVADIGTLVEFERPFLNPPEVMLSVSELATYDPVVGGKQVWRASAEDITNTGFTPMASLDVEGGTESEDTRYRVPNTYVDGWAKIESVDPEYPTSYTTLPTTTAMEWVIEVEGSPTRPGWREVWLEYKEQSSSTWITAFQGRINAPGEGVFRRNVSVSGLNGVYQWRLRVEQPWPGDPAYPTYMAKWTWTGNTTISQSGKVQWIAVENE